MIFGVIYIVFIMLTMFSVIRERKSPKKSKYADESIRTNSKNKKIALLIVLCTMFMYYIIGYIFKTDILNFITLRTNSVSFSFIGAVLLFVTSIIIGTLLKSLDK